VIRNCCLMMTSQPMRNANSKTNRSPNQRHRRNWKMMILSYGLNHVAMSQSRRRCVWDPGRDLRDVHFRRHPIHQH
jgi:hypothetical protein